MSQEPRVVGSSPIATNPPTPAATSVMPRQLSGPGHGSTPSTVAGDHVRPSAEVHAPPPTPTQPGPPAATPDMPGLPTGVTTCQVSPGGIVGAGVGGRSRRCRWRDRRRRRRLRRRWHLRDRQLPRVRQERADDRGPEQGGRQQQRCRHENEDRSGTRPLLAQGRLDDSPPDLVRRLSSRDGGNQRRIAAEVRRRRATGVTRPEVGLELVGFDRIEREVDRRGGEQQDPLVAVHDAAPSATSCSRTVTRARDMSDRVALWERPIALAISSPENPCHS